MATKRSRSTPVGRSKASTDVGGAPGRASAKTRSKAADKAPKGSEGSRRTTRKPVPTSASLKRAAARAPASTTASKKRAVAKTAAVGAAVAKGATARTSAARAATPKKPAAKAATARAGKGKSASAPRARGVRSPRPTPGEEETSAAEASARTAAAWAELVEGRSPTDRAPKFEAPQKALAPLSTEKVERGGAGRALPIEIDPARIEESLRKLGGELSHWANQGRYTKVRFKFRGKPLLPDLPLAAVVAAEGLTFYWGGILRALLMNVAGGSLLAVELVHDADKEVQSGKEALLSGDLDEALARYRRAVSMQRDGAAAHLNLGIALKLKGEREEARSALQRAKALDPDGPIGVEADKLLKGLVPGIAP